MKGYIAVEIPTKKYIKAFICHHMGDKPVMSRDHAIGSKLCDLLIFQTNEDRKKFSKHYNAVLRVYISMHVFHRRGCNLNETNIKYFNLFVEEILKKQFYFLMDFYIKIFPNFEANLPLVREDLGIDDENWSTDSMKKDYYRYRKSTGRSLLYRKIPAATVPSKHLQLPGF